jgi:hypothetical protein
VAAKRKQLDEMGLLLNQERVAIGMLDAKAQKLMAGTNELYATAKAHADTTIKQQKDLNMRMIAVGQWELTVVEREQELQEKEEEAADTLERGRSKLSSHEANLDTREATVEVEQQRMGELCASLLAHKLEADLQANSLASWSQDLADREKELVDREKGMAEKQL